MPRSTLKKRASVRYAPLNGRSKHRSGGNENSDDASDGSGADEQMLQQQQQHEVAFARRLAAPQLSTRNKAVRVMRQMLHARRMSELELLKMWKALFYTLWHSDKLQVQQELACNLATMVHAPASLVGQKEFLESFYATMIREWNGIDLLRLDKFYHILKQMQCEALVLLARTHWDEEAVVAVMAVWTQYPLRVRESASERCAVGVTAHLIDNFIPAIENVAEDPELVSPPADVIQGMLLPFMIFYCRTDDKRLRQRVFDEVISKLVLLDGIEHADVDHRSIGRLLWRTASSEGVSAAVRKQLYRLLQRAALHHKLPAASYAEDSEDEEPQGELLKATESEDEMEGDEVGAVDGVDEDEDEEQDEEGDPEEHEQDGEEIGSEDSEALGSDSEEEDAEVGGDDSEDSSDGESMREIMRQVADRYGRGDAGAWATRRAAMTPRLSFDGPIEPARRRSKVSTPLRFVSDEEARVLMSPRGGFTSPPYTPPLTRARQLKKEDFACSDGSPSKKKVVFNTKANLTTRFHRRASVTSITPANPQPSPMKPVLKRPLRP